MKITDKEITNKANSLFALANEWKDNEKYQEECWDFIIENIDTLLRLAYRGARPEDRELWLNGNK